MVTSLGEGTALNFDALCRGESGVRMTSAPRVTQSSVMAGIVQETLYDVLRGRYGVEFTRAELLSIACIDGLGGIPDGRTALVTASAKGNASLLEGRCQSGPFIPEDNDIVLPEVTWCRVGARFGFSRKDIYMISNACISGVSALTVARRLILSGRYDNAVVVGTDVQNRFITSGFASFKSLSPEHCLPYDAARCGLNLGEASGAILLTKVNADASISIDGGCITDDANHISGPSRTGDGLFLAMRGAMTEAGVLGSDIDMLQMHGTATAYNDEMESKAAALAGLDNVPVQSLKPYFGHTMGASGIIETIIAAEELKQGIFIGTKGYSDSGVSVRLDVTSDNRVIPGAEYLLKTASGFGGTNAAVLLHLDGERHGETGVSDNADCQCLVLVANRLRTVRKVCIESGSIVIDGATVFSHSGADFGTFIREAYKSGGESGMKFYKMDDFCKLGYVAAERLLEGITFGKEECGIVLSGRYGCLDTDMRHQRIIDTDGDSAASPAVFVYTLPNVVAGEISIRHHIKGENTWFWSGDKSMSDIREYAGLMLSAVGMKYAIVGHLDCIAGTYGAVFELVEAV